MPPTVPPPRVPGRIHTTSKESTVGIRPRDGIDTNQAGPKDNVEDGPVRRQSTVVVRKKLPWLDGPQQSKAPHVPGSFESTESVNKGDILGSTLSAQDDFSSLGAPKAFAPSLDRDPVLRAVGSTPSLRKRPKSGEFKTLSVSSKLRTGIVAPTTRAHAKQVLGVVDEGARAANVVSSEYSTTPSPGKDDSPAALTGKDAAYFEKLADRRAGAKLADPQYVANQWLQSNLDLPLDEPSPGKTSRVEVRPPHPGRRKESCRSCDNVDSPRTLPKTRTMPRRSVALPPPEPAPPAFQATRLARKPTLFAMPDHLMLSSSSGSSPKPAARQPEVYSQPLVQPVPRRSIATATARTNDKRDSFALNRAVNGLENLMEEALHVARDAAQTGRNEDVATILNSATLALRKASTINANMDQGQMNRPLRLSPPESPRQRTDSDSISSDSDASSHSSRHSEETAPTLFTMTPQPSQQPMLKEQYRMNEGPPRSHKASFESTARRERSKSLDHYSMTNTPPRLYQPPSADSIVRDFAYAKQKVAKAEAARALSRSHGAAEDYYGDTGDSVASQPGIRPSISKPIIVDKPLPPIPAKSQRRPQTFAEDIEPPHGRRQHVPVRRLEHAATQTIPPRTSSHNFTQRADTDVPIHQLRPRKHRPHHISEIFESHNYHERNPDRARSISPPEKRDSLITDARYEEPPLQTKDSISKADTRYSGPTALLTRDISLRHPRRKHISLREGQGFSLGRYHRRKPIAREWNMNRKRITATIACLNTVFVGLTAGIYAGEVPAIQYQLADTNHRVILGNVVLFACLGITTILAWPLPLLHGRKPYTLLSFALMLPLMFPQALAVSGFRSPYNPIYRCGLLIPRAFQGVAIGFANINFLPTLFDLFGASLMSDKPHQEIVVYDDVRRQGGGIGV